MDLKLKDEIAVVVGCASGIGEAIAREFTAEGCRVAWIDRAEMVREVANACADDALAIVADATDPQQMIAAADEVARSLGPVRHLAIAVAASSGKFGYPFWNLQPKDWAHSLNVTLMGPVTSLCAFTPSLLKSDRGSVCMIGSVAGQIGSQTDPPYSAAKAGVINFAQAAAKDFAHHNIRVNVVSPGMVKTPMNRSVWQAWSEKSQENSLSYEQWADEKINQIAPLGQWQTPQEIAAMVAFLASPQAANITGQTLNVDGGQVMHS